MAYDTMLVRDAAGDEQVVAGQRETEGTSKFFQVYRLVFGAAGSVPTLVSATVPLPVTGRTKWTALDTIATVLNGDATAPTLKNLASAANKISTTAIDNSDAANRFQYADFELFCRGQSAMTAGTTLSLWIIESLDGTNFEDGSDSVTPARPPDERFFVRAVSTAQRLVIRGLLLPPTKFKILLSNDSGVGLTNTDGDNVLRMRTYGEVSL